jgi:hypothetical protein
VPRGLLSDLEVSTEEAGAVISEAGAVNSEAGAVISTGAPSCDMLHAPARLLRCALAVSKPASLETGW